MSDSDPKRKDPWELGGEGEFVDRMFDDPLFVDPAEAEAMALRDLEEGRVVEGQLQAVLAACINRLDRILRELSEDHEPGESRLGFSLSPAAAPLFGLRDALEFGLQELRDPGFATAALMRRFEMVLGMGREQLVALGVPELLPEMGAPTLEAPAGSGREMFAWWWEAVGLVERTYLRVGLMAPGFMRAEALLTTEGRLDSRRIDSAGERLNGGHLQLMGLARGVALLRDAESARELESGVRDLITSWMGGARWWSGVSAEGLS